MILPYHPSTSQYVLLGKPPHSGSGVFYGLTPIYVKFHILEFYLYLIFFFLEFDFILNLTITLFSLTESLKTQSVELLFI